MANAPGSASCAGRRAPPVLAGVGVLLVSIGQLVAVRSGQTRSAGSSFFWVNQFIITPQSLAARREIKEDITCVDCGKIARGYRLVRSGDHYRTSDREPEFRCEECSTKKSDELRERGVRGEAGYPFQCREPDIKKFKISS